MKKNQDFFIYDHCIACTTCSSVAPFVFKLATDGSTAIVYNQPSTEQFKSKTIEAMRSCPVSAIGVQKK